VLNDILGRFDANIARVENLKSIYGPARPGRRKVQETDILRAALVLLHATMEDFLRSLQGWKAPGWTKEAVDKYPLAGNGRKRPEKFSLGELVAHRGKTVDDLIVQSVTEYLDQYSSYNDLGQVKDALLYCGISNQDVEAHNYGLLPAMIERRHNIVHKADRNDQVGGQGNHRTKSIEVSQIDKYLMAVKNLRQLVEAQLG
jgi:hypothetical protein